MKTDPRKATGGGCARTFAPLAIAIIILLFVFSPQVPILGPLLAAEADRAATGRAVAEGELVIAEAQAAILSAAAEAVAWDRRAAHPILWLAEGLMSFALVIVVAAVTVIVAVMALRKGGLVEKL